MMENDRSASVENRLLQSHIATLEQLLEVYEKSVLEITDELYAEIAKRKQIEEELRQSEERYRTIMEEMEEWYFETNLEGDITFSNDILANALGSSRKNLIGLNVQKFVRKEDSGSVSELFDTVLKTGKSTKNFPYESIHTDGTLASVEFSVFPKRDKEAKIVGFRGVGHDISKRKKADQALRESEIKFRTLFESASDSIFLMDQDIFIDCNQKTLEMFGCTREQIVGQTPYRFSPEVQPDGRNSLKTTQEKINAAMGGQPQLFEWRHCRYDGTPFDAEVSLNVFSVAGKNYLQGFVHDITERKRAEERIQYLATHDSLTGLPNRLMFSQLLNHSIQSARHHKRQLAVFFIDLDRFKIINDTMGHDAGDQLLQEISVRFKQSLRAADVVGRLGGDEFIILIEEVNELTQVAIVAKKILANTLKPVILMGEECRVTASMGISIYPTDGADEQSLMKNADIAMYFAKEEGKNNYQFYSKDIQSQSIERLSIEENLRLALERNELSLHYQAKVDFKTNVITGVEALLRWQNPHLGTVTPMQFLQVAEESGLIIPIGRWVMKTACAQNVAWQRQGLPAIGMAVNLSLRQLTDDNLIDDIGTALNDSGMAPNLLELEIAESMVMYNPAHIIPILAKIKGLDVRLAMDDFGTGYSSLAQIKHFPFDTLKVDRSFIRNIPKDAEDKAIIEAIIAMGKTLSLTVIAEGVETLEQKSYLMERSCDEMQGFYFSKPIVAEQFADLLRKQVSSPPM